jgi:uncharacterized Zn finger protein
MYNLSTTRQTSLSAWFNNLREFELDNIFETHILGRAYEYVSTIKIGETAPNKIAAVSKGVNEYQLFIEYDKAKIIGTCSCPYDGPCKHLAALILLRMTRLKS